MTDARPFYDALFADRMMERLNNDPIYRLKTGVLYDLKQHGFFGFLRHSKSADDICASNTLIIVLEQLSVSNPELASEIIERELPLIGLRHAAKLIDKFNIQYSLDNLRASILSWLPLIEKQYSRAELSETNIQPAEFISELSSTQIMSRFYQNLIFWAETEDEKSLVKRLFIAAPIIFVDYETLRYHRDFNADTFSLLTHGGETTDRHRIAARAITLALQGQLNGNKLAASETPTNQNWTANIALARLCSMDTADVVLNGFGQCLSESKVSDEVACVLVLGIIQEHLDSTPSQMRSAALISELSEVKTALGSSDSVDNFDMAVNLFRVVVNYALVDPRPLMGVLDYCNSIGKSQPEAVGAQVGSFPLMLKHALFNKPSALKASEIRGPYGDPALKRLLASGVATLTPTGEVDLLAPSLSAYGSPVKESIAEFSLKCLKHQFGSAKGEGQVTSREAQAMVDSGIFSAQDWKKISSSKNASKNITKAHLPASILELVGDRIREMALEQDLGL